jgi:hypothetical protein
MINRSQLKFHETFQPELSYIAKLLELADRDYAGDKYEISELTGIPTGKQKGKVEPHIKYAAYMGLISFTNEKGVYTLNISDVGKELFEQDPLFMKRSQDGFVIVVYQGSGLVHLNGITLCIWDILAFIGQIHQHII